MIIDQFITTAARRKKAPKEMIMISKSNKTVRTIDGDPAIIQLVRLGEGQPAKTLYYVSEFNGHYQTTRGTWLDCSTYL